MDAYKSSKGLDVLKQTEYGLYGLTAANGLGEAVTGKDMFGNELTDEQCQNSLMNALGIAGVAGAAKYVDKQKFMPKNEATSTTNLKPPNLLKELAECGVKYNPVDVLSVTKTSSGKLVWLEKGNSKAGLEHVMNHADDIAAKGIKSNDIPELLMKALSEGEVVGYQGRGKGRPIYEVVFNGKKQRVAITVGNNGFIVGANPTSLP